VLPIAFFAYSVGELLRHQNESQAATESTQIARVSTALVEEHFRQSTAFLESIATRRELLETWKKRDLEGVERDLKQASSLRPDFVFVSLYDLDDTQALLQKNGSWQQQLIDEVASVSQPPTLAKSAGQS